MTLIDTNILIYASGVNGDRERQGIAVAALREARQEGALAVQVLAAYSHVMLRRRVPTATVRQDVAALRAAWTLLSPEAETTRLARPGVYAHRLSFWNAMLWALAKQNGVTVILSEDGPRGSVVDQVAFRSPF